MSFVIANVEVIVRRGDRFLMIVRSADEDFGAGWCCFPGGKLDPGIAEPDALERTAVRELSEEVDLDADPASMRFVEAHTFLIDDVTILDIVMLTDAATGDPRAVDPAEVAEVAWMTADDVMTDPRVQEWTRESLRLALARYPHPA